MMTTDAIHFDETPDRLRVSWDNRRTRSFMFWFLVLFWIIWAPMTCGATAMIFRSDSPVFFMVWSVFGWVLTIGIPAKVFQSCRNEWIELDAQVISWGGKGLLAAKKESLPLSRVAELGFGHYSEPVDEETIATLSIFEPPVDLGRLRHRPRHLLGYWLPEREKKVIFERIRDFVSRREIELKTTYYPRYNGMLE